jgi:hypothetical protein
MDAREVTVTQLIVQLQTYLEDLRAGRPMNRDAAVQFNELLPDLRAAVADCLIAIGILRDDERDWV